jgi:hypothetical protein
MITAMITAATIATTMAAVLRAACSQPIVRSASRCKPGRRPFGFHPKLVRAERGSGGPVGPRRRHGPKDQGSDRQERVDDKADERQRAPDCVGEAVAAAVVVVVHHVIRFIAPLVMRLDFVVVVAVVVANDGGVQARVAPAGRDGPPDLGEPAVLVHERSREL